MSKDPYYFEHEPDHSEDIMPFKIYRYEGKNIKNEDVSIMIAKCYEEGDAILIVEALKNM